MMATVEGKNRFDSDATRYAAYLGTPEGRLRVDLPFANLQGFLPSAPEIKSLRALDLGCGTGASSVRLARLGVHVTSMDSSPAMLDLAQRSAAEAGVSNKITLKQGDAAQLGGIFQKEFFDIILCHNLLEFVEAPGSLLSSARTLLRDTSSILSVLVRNQAGEVLKAALQAGDLAGAEQTLTAECGNEALYGGNVRLFTPATLEAMLNEASLTLTARRGVRVIADYLPPQISRSAEYEQIFALEHKLGKRSDFFGVARYLHCLARDGSRRPKEDE
jgi:2-polyprenyl-3-methyl-5-hydroxy-6-metoxy-1,4-benzoquinol methylase